MQVKWNDNNGFFVPHTVWEHNNKCVIHSENDVFVCAWLGDENHAKGEVANETRELSVALRWLQE